MRHLNFYSQTTTKHITKFESHTHTFESPIAIALSTFFKDCIEIIYILHTIIYCPLLGEACGSRYGQETVGQDLW